MNSQLLIGAASSGSGKTTFTLGLLRAFKNRGLLVQPFKCGPDYIDTSHHRVAAGRPAINLDLFMASEEHLRYLYSHYGRQAEVCVTEGVMGLFDGFDGMQGSSAQVAHVLDIPVLLIVNAKAMAYSAAPLLHGFKTFYKGIRVVGAVFNFVAGENHYNYLKQACEDAGILPLGYLPKQQDISIPSRYLGLRMEAGAASETFMDTLAALVEKYVEVDTILALGGQSATPAAPVCEEAPQEAPIIRSASVPAMHIAVARDEAFNFMYYENIKQLRRLGDVAFFSPLTDAELPAADLVYLPGGYPELHLPELAANASMLQSIRDYAEQGGKLLAECGGMMYLCRCIEDAEGASFPMVGLLPQTATMRNSRLVLGYRVVQYNGNIFRGHEFHYSSILPEEQPLPSVAHLFTARSQPVKTALWRYKNVIAGYTHLYWGEWNVMTLWK